MHREIWTHSIGPAAGPVLGLLEFLTYSEHRFSIANMVPKGRFQAVPNAGHRLQEDAGGEDQPSLGPAGRVCHCQRRRE